MSVKPRSVPTKQLAQNLAAAGSTLYLNNTLDWDGAQLSSADFGTQLFASLRNSSNTQLELVELDPATVTSSAAITILKRALGYDGTQVASTETAYDWLAGDTFVQLGSDTPQLLAQLVEESGAETIAGVKTFSSIPKTTGGNATDDNELVRYAQAVAMATGTTNINRVVIAGNAGETVAAGNLLYLDVADGEWKKCDADTAATVENINLGIAQGAGTDGNSISGGVLTYGLDSNQTGLTTNTKYYASNTAGGISTSAGTTEVTVGISRSTTSIFFNPRFDQQITEDLQDALAGTGGTPSGSNKFVTQQDTGGLFVPTGTPIPWLTSSAPTGYLLCDGSAVSRTTYAALFAVISDTFGVGDGSTTFNLPNMKNRMLIGVDSTQKVVIEDCEDAWNELVDSDVTATLDTVDFKTGSGSAKFVVAAGASAGDILATEVISSTSFAGRTTIRLWIKSSVACSSGDLQLLLDDSANCASPLESLDIPALVAGVWTKVTLTLATPHLDTAIISVGIKMVVDKGAFTLNIDDIATGDNYELGGTGGAKTHTLKAAELAAHTHSISVQQAGNTASTVGTGNTNANGTGATAANTGDLAHNNMPPYFAVNYIIKT